jgi:hypothetical protein
VHPECVGLSNDEAEGLEVYTCPLCKKHEAAFQNAGRVSTGAAAGQAPHPRAAAGAGDSRPVARSTVQGSSDNGISSDNSSDSDKSSDSD